MLASQGLLTQPAAPAVKTDIMPVIRQMQYLQIDTIQAVRRSQYLVLWSRLGDFDPAWLDEVHQSGELFEYYAHALCYLPIEDYPIFRGRMLYDARVGNHRRDWAQEHASFVEHVRSYITENGAVSSSDFDSQTVSTGWGDVKREKLALQHMFSTGELMVPYRQKFRRYYDLRERVLPDWDDARALDADTALEELIIKTVYALGVALEAWIPGYYYLLKGGLSEKLERLVSESRLLPVRVEGWEASAYVHPDRVAMVESCTSGALVPSHTTLLSPFDPLVSDRDRALTLFDFDYRLECFTPAKDRMYGYFCLPILYHDRLIGRLDPKAHRKEKRMEIKTIYLEPGVLLGDQMIEALKEVLNRFTHWHGMHSLEIGVTDPPELREALVS